MDASDLEEIVPLISIHGIPTTVRDTREAYQKQLAVYLILASTLFERIAFYILAATLAITADPEDYSSTKGPIAALIFTGTSNLSTLIFGVLSDWKFGRAKTIIVGFILYLIGYIMATIFMSNTIEACTNIPKTKTLFDEPCAPWILPTLIAIAIGAGAVQANMAVFGAEQTQQSRITSRYFYKYVFVVNIGAIFAKFAFRFTGNDIYIAYLYATSVLIVAALLFIIGRRYYIHVKSYDSVIIQCIPVIINAFQKWYQYKKNKRSIHQEHATAPPSESVTIYNRVSSIVEESMSINEEPSTFLDFAKATNHGKFQDRIVDDVKSLRSAFVVFSLLIPYWLIYDQLDSTFRLQAKHMQETGVNSMVIVSLADPVILIIGILILNIFVYKYMDSRNKSMKIVNKFVIGMCFGVITMCVAGTVEKFRQDQWHQDYNVSDLKIYNQIPQGLCMGVSELFVMVASFEFAYFAAPRSAQTLFMSLRFFSIGISSFIGVAYIAAFTTGSFDLDFSTRPEQDMKWRFYTYFFILAGLQLIFIIIFIVCQQKYRLFKLNRQQIERGHFRQHSSVAWSTR